MFSRSSWAHNPQIRIRRERFPNKSKGAKEAWSVSLQQLPLCLPWLHYGQRTGGGCVIGYINPGWGWDRSGEARGRGGPFSSSAQHKPVRKHADSFNNINERQTSGEQALRLWGPAGPSNREILPPPLPTLQNLDMCLLREGVFMCGCSSNMRKKSPRERWISRVKASFQCEDFLPVIILENLGLALLREKKSFLKNEIDECLKTWERVKGYFISHLCLDICYSKLSLFQINENSSNYLKHKWGVYWLIKTKV